MKRILLVSLQLLILFCLWGCEKFLDEKTDKKLVNPSTVQDLQALLNDPYIFSAQYPMTGEVAAGDFYWLSKDWEALTSLSVKLSYIWHHGEDIYSYANRNDWSLSYITIYTANVILEALDEMRIKNGTKFERDDIYGQALFFRSYAFYHLLQQFAKPWDSNTSNIDQGIALRLSSNLNIPTTRATVDDCYQQILKDIKKAADMLSETATIKTRPTKVAAYGFLSRVYLNMGLYDEAYQYADKALQYNSYLMDFNSLDSSQQFPFTRFNNDEVLIHTLIVTPGAMYPPTLRVDSVLYASYDDNDLRKSLFFSDNEDGTHSFRGSYDGSGILVNGPTTGEMYLIRAECSARMNNIKKSMDDLNSLLIKRWHGQFSPVTAETSLEALTLVLRERRKELVFRGGIRWSDLRRLNKEPQFAVILTREINGQQYTLPPNDNRYVFPLPPDVLSMTDIEQNPR